MTGGARRTVPPESVARISRTRSGFTAWLRWILTKPSGTDLLQHLSQGADVAQPACAAQANVRLVTLGLEVVDLVGVHDPLPSSREVQQHLALSQCHGEPFVPHPGAGWEQTAH